MTNHLTAVAAAVLATCAASAQAQTLTKGPSTSITPYVQGVLPGVDITSILTTGDKVGSYRMGGIPDGLGAFDNGNGTFTVLMNHEIGNALGVTRDYGGQGAYVSSWVINKSDLSVVSGGDLIKKVYGWDSTNQSVGAQITNWNSSNSFNRFCSADLSPISAYYNPATGLGTMDRIYMHGEEGGARGWQMATVATGADKGNSYVLGKFNPSTNGSGLTAVGGWENALANPYAQNKTIVIGNNDGGTGVLNNALAVYVGTKTNSGTAIDRAGLTNGTTMFVNVAGNSAEIPAANAATRATGIASGTAFTLSSSASTTFSRPEDGAWTLDGKHYYFATTDRLDTTEAAGGTQKGATRLWRLNFTDVTDPTAGGTIDLVIDGGSFAGGVGATKPNMFDNISVNSDGTVTLLEDTGGADHNGKIWQYDPSSGQLKILAKADALRFGELDSSGTWTGPTLRTTPTAAGFHTNDEETSGVIDVSDILGKNDGKKYQLFVTQDHASASGLQAAGLLDLTANPAELVEGGQLMLMTTAAVPEPETYALMLAGLGLVAGVARRRRQV